MTVAHRSLLKHRSFKWGDASKQLTKAINRNGAKILKLVGYWEEYDLDPARPFAHKSAFCQDPEIVQDALEYINELIGELLRAAAIEIDGGNVAIKPLITVLKKIKKDPRLLRNRGQNLISDVLVELGRHYQRDEENPGTHWMDIGEIGSRRLKFRKEPSAENIRRAAKLAIAELEMMGSQRRPQRISANFLADKLSRLFRRFGRRITRIVDPPEPERGFFKDFVTLTVGPLNEILQAHNVKQYSINLIVRKGAERRLTESRGVKVL